MTTLALLLGIALGWYARRFLVVVRDVLADERAHDEADEERDRGRAFGLGFKPIPWPHNERTHPGPPRPLIGTKAQVDRLFDALEETIPDRYVELDGPTAFGPFHVDYVDDHTITLHRVHRPVRHPNEEKPAP